ncbi:MAG: NAD-dependent epimerase/dehydratase family protein [Bacteroidota bacterium]
MNRTLVIGACGQLGTELTSALRELKGNENVIASDIKESPDTSILSGPYEKLDVLDREAFHGILAKYQIEEVYHLAAILSARGERDPLFAWNLNMNSLLNVLEAGRNTIKKIYWPSSIAVFGPDTPKDQTPQHTLMNPTTTYGISKLAGERWCEYYFEKFGVDVRSLRYPGLIGYKSLPGGGTTDYAVDIYHKAVKHESFECFLSSDTILPMMYMDDAVKATIDIMEAESSKVKIRSSYNLSAMSFTPAEMAAEIKKSRPDFQVTYNPDYRQKIADSWPNTIDDTAARKDWGWQPKYDLELLTQTMLENLEASMVLH